MEGTVQRCLHAPVARRLGAAHWRWAVASCVALTGAVSCSSSGADTPAAATSPVVTTTAPSQPAIAAAFPTDDTTGVPQDRSLTKWSGSLRTSEAQDLPTELVRGQRCKVFADTEFDFGTSGGYLYVDDPCVVLRADRFTTSAAVSNTGAMVQQAEENRLLVVEQSEFDGGPYHQRGVQADYSDLVVQSSRFTRFGNAAVEMNDRDGTASFEMHGNFLQEPGGWTPSDHVDGFQVGGAGRVEIISNTVLVTPFGGDTTDFDYVSNSTLGLWAEAGNVAGPVTIEGNLLAGGGKLLYLQQKSGFTFESEVQVVGNTFDRRFTGAGGIWGVLADQGLPSDLVWTDNTWEDGTPVDLAAARADG
jgi:hypothetical protein